MTSPPLPIDRSEANLSASRSVAPPRGKSRWRWLALGTPLAETPDAAPRALAQAERAILETLEHHGHVRLRPVGHG